MPEPLEPTPLGDVFPEFAAGMEAAAAGAPPAGWDDWPIIREAGGHRHA